MPDVADTGEYPSAFIGSRLGLFGLMAGLVRLN
jgi:hypothetical protein